MTPKKLFFSYSRVDGLAFAKRLAADLEKQGFDVWIDQEDIKAGLRWDKEIERALESCDCVLFLETEKSVVSNHVLDEVYYALEQNKKVIPLIYVDSKTPFRLKRLQHINFTQDYDTGLNMLLNELKGNTTTIAYAIEGNALSERKKRFASSSLAFVIIASLVLLIAAVFTLTAKEESGVTVETKGAIAATDTTTSNSAPGTNVPATEMHRAAGEVGKTKQPNRPVEIRRENRDKKATFRSGNGHAGQTVANAARTENHSASLNESVSGDWQLMDVEPKAQSHRGYLKIEALGENKVAVKSYMQFYYPDSRMSSYLTVFNAFVNCPSCPLKEEMRLIAEDIAVGSRTVRKLSEDQPDGKKAGEIIFDASANKSVGGMASLHFKDNNHAVIKIKQPRTITLANELMLEPFVYTFRFRKAE